MLKRILFSFLFLLLCLSFIQSTVPLFTPKKLEGFEVHAVTDTLSRQTWFEGKYQQSKEKLINETIGLREFFVRLYNQYNYSIFNVSESPGVVIGKKNYLYLTSYTNNYTGKNFLGKPDIESKVKDIRTLQDVLKKKNIDLIIAFAPGKASFYPEYLPDDLSKPVTENNYSVYKQLFSDYHVNFLDLHACFREIKNNTPYKLYPKYGVHWNYYGAYLAADTLKKYIEHIHGCTLPDLVLDKVELRDSLTQPDYDVGKLLNTFTEEKDTMPYPVVSYRDKPGQVKPKTLIISDSYTWLWYEEQFMQHVFTDWSFWFYNNTMYPESFTAKKSTGEIDYPSAILNKDVIVVLASECAYDLFPYGLLQKTERLYLPDSKDALVEYYKTKIKGDTAWYQKIIEKAAAKSITVEQALQEDAEWIYQDELNKKK